MKCPQCNVELVWHTAPDTGELFAHCQACGWREGDPQPAQSPPQLVILNRLGIATQIASGLCAAIDDYSGSRMIDQYAIAVDALAIADALIKREQETRTHD